MKIVYKNSLTKRFCLGLMAFLVSTVTLGTYIISHSGISILLQIIGILLIWGVLILYVYILSINVCSVSIGEGMFFIERYYGKNLSFTVKEVTFSLEKIGTLEARFKGRDVFDHSKSNEVIVLRSNSNKFLLGHHESCSWEDLVENLLSESKLT